MAKDWEFVEESVELAWVVDTLGQGKPDLPGECKAKSCQVNQ